MITRYDCSTAPSPRRARLRLAGSQLVVALARRSDGSFCYQSADVVVTESACVDGS